MARIMREMLSDHKAVLERSAGFDGEFVQSPSASSPVMARESLKDSRMTRGLNEINRRHCRGHTILIFPMAILLQGRQKAVVVLCAHQSLNNRGPRPATALLRITRESDGDSCGASAGCHMSQPHTFQSTSRLRRNHTSEQWRRCQNVETTDIIS